MTPTVVYPTDTFYRYTFLSYRYVYRFLCRYILPLHVPASSCRYIYSANVSIPFSIHRYILPFTFYRYIPPLHPTITYTVAYRYIPLSIHRGVCDLPDSVGLETM